jgi:DNA-directed RNA polymerase subunit omega
VSAVDHRTVSYAEELRQRGDTQALNQCCSPLSALAFDPVTRTNPFDNPPRRLQGQHSLFRMLAVPLSPSVLAAGAPTILQFPTEANRAVRSLRHMTTQLLQEAAQVIPNQQLLINVVSKRVRQLGLGHRPMVETTPRMSLTDIALKEIIAGKLAYESLTGSSDNE